jgi:dUTP pyrophosphatase
MKVDVPVLKYFKTHPDVPDPKFGTFDAACFDLAYCPAGKSVIEGYGALNAKLVVPLHPSYNVTICPMERLLIPTGLIFKIPEGYSLRIHPRSGLSLKDGITLANCEGVIDADYFHETFLMMTNIGQMPFCLSNGDRLAQAELVPVLRYGLEETTMQPTQISDRVGGLGSTGTK